MSLLSDLQIQETWLHIDCRFNEHDCTCVLTKLAFNKLLSQVCSEHSEHFKQKWWGSKLALSSLKVCWAYKSWLKILSSLLNCWCDLNVLIFFTDLWHSVKIDQFLRLLKIHCLKISATSLCLFLIFWHLKENNSLFKSSQADLKFHYWWTQVSSEQTWCKHCIYFLRLLFISVTEWSHIHWSKIA